MISYTVNTTAGRCLSFMNPLKGLNKLQVVVEEFRSCRWN